MNDDETIHVEGKSEQFTQIFHETEDSPRTDRYVGTDRYCATESFSETERFQQRTSVFTESFQKAPKFAPLNTEQEKIIADRYQIEEGPLGGNTGEAEVFRCLDLHDNGATMAVKIYRIDIKPEESILDQLRNLDHPDLVRLLSHGEWQGRFYEVMEYCAGGSMGEYPAWEEGNLRPYLKEIINGLQYLHTLSIVHQDIKPGNIFFRKKGKKDLVIGDFGISSGLDSISGIHQHKGFSGTIDYAAPELIAGHTASIQSDYYALGITLLHLLSGQSPFNGLQPVTISARHAMGTIPIPDTLSIEFQQIVKGLTQFYPENRWGYRQVLAWIKKEPIFADDGSSWRAKPKYESRPYPGYPQARTPQELAAAIGFPGFEEIIVAKDLFRGDIRQWIKIHHGDDALAERVDNLAETHSTQKELAVHKLRYLLDPHLPLIINSKKEIHEITELIELLREAVLNRQSDLVTAFKEGHIEAWLEGTTEAGKNLNFIETLRNLRSHHDKTPYLGLYKLLYNLAPETPLILDEEHSVSGPLELIHTVNQNPHLHERSIELLYDGYLEAWIQLSFTDSADLLNLLASCRSEQQQDRELGLMRLSWHMDPTLPIPFGDQLATTSAELADLIDKDTESWNRGVQLIRNGWLRTWLIETGKLPNHSEYDSFVNNSSGSLGACLESILHLLHPGLPEPILKTSVHQLNAGSVQADSSITHRIYLQNEGRGYLFGAITLEGSAGIKLNQNKIDGEPVELEVTIKPMGLPLGVEQKALILIQTNGGELTIPVRYKIIVPQNWILQSLGWGIFWGTIFGLFRLSLEKFVLKGKYQGMSLFTLWDKHVSMNLFEKQPDLFWSLVGHAIPFTLVLAGLVILLIRMGKRQS